jgi:hypothetical protein
MGWSVGYRPPRESDLIDEILLAAGKALYLANRFEEKCSYVLRMANLVDLLESDPVLTLEEAASRLPAGHMLGRTVRDLASRTDMGMTQDMVAALTNARLARNYIAHEGAASLGDPHSYNVQRMLDALRALRPRVRDLAEGDNLVSLWVYKIGEPREPTPLLAGAYLELVDDWLFGHMPPKWLDVNWRCDRKPPKTLREHMMAAASYQPWYSWKDERLHDAEEASRRRQLIERKLYSPSAEKDS